MPSDFVVVKLPSEAFLAIRDDIYDAFQRTFWVTIRDNPMSKTPYEFIFVRSKVSSLQAGSALQLIQELDGLMRLNPLEAEMTDRNRERLIQLLQRLPIIKQSLSTAPGHPDPYASEDFKPRPDYNWPSNPTSWPVKDENGRWYVTASNTPYLMPSVESASLLLQPFGYKFFRAYETSEGMPTVARSKDGNTWEYTSYRAWHEIEGEWQGRFVDACMQCANKIATSVCSKCENAHYCSQDCAQAHWTEGGHKDACQ